MASTRKSPAGNYEVRYRDPQGRPRQQTFERAAEARDFEHRIELEKKRPDAWVDSRKGQTAFGGWAEDTLAGRLNLRPASRSRDEIYLRKHLLPVFGSTPLSRIQKAHVQEWVRRLSEEKTLAPRTVRECYRIFASLMVEAVEDKLIAETPCRKIHLPRVESQEKRFLSSGEVARLAEAIDPRFRALIYSAAYLGCRWGELAGLKREHLSLHALGRPAQVRIVGSLERFENGYRYVEETKTISGRRNLTVPAFLSEILDEHLASAVSSEFVFPAPEGCFLRYHGFRRRYWKAAVTRAELSPLTFHELRHTCAALLIDQGADPLVVHRRLGHKHISTTYTYYGHLFPNREVELNEALEKLYRATETDARVGFLWGSDSAAVASRRIGEGS